MHGGISISVFRGQPPLFLLLVRGLAVYKVKTAESSAWKGFWSAYWGPANVAANRNETGKKVAVPEFQRRTSVPEGTTARKRAHLS